MPQATQLPAPAPAPVNLGANGPATNATQTTPAAAPAPGTTQTPPANASNRQTIAPAIAKLFAVPQAPLPVSLDVSYRVERDPNVIVTVFTNPKTGQEVAQIPPEVLIHLAAFFDQSTGVTLDKNA
ncbi:MAG: hypothetical protein JO199_07710 [Candidatus Eremiobacteraeota bacterium]|nr:hypothetical protein [Candidatus Eremiobacteraeota bacterium]